MGDDNKEVVLKVLEEDLYSVKTYSYSKEIGSTLEKGFNFITLDFEDVQLVDSLGISTLLIISKKLKEKKGKLKIINMRDEVKTMFNLLNLRRELIY